MKHKIVYCNNYNGLNFYIHGLIEYIQKMVKKPWLSRR